MSGEALSEFVGARLPPFLFNILKSISRSTGVGVSQLLRTAIISWLQGLPEAEGDLPPELRVPMARAVVDHKIRLISDLRFLMWSRQKAERVLKGLRKERALIDPKSSKRLDLPPHIARQLEAWENDLIACIDNLDEWLKGAAAMEE